MALDTGQPSAFIPFKEVRLSLRPPTRQGWFPFYRELDRFAVEIRRYIGSCRRATLLLFRPVAAVSPAPQEKRVNPWAYDSS
jgi:hypothetical protein